MLNKPLSKPAFYASPRKIADEVAAYLRYVAITGSHSTLKREKEVSKEVYYCASTNASETSLDAYGFSGQTIRVLSSRSLMQNGTHYYKMFTISVK